MGASAVEKKAIKVLTKKLGREPTEKEIAKKVKKLEAKAGGNSDESPKKRKAEESEESSNKKAKGTDFTAKATKILKKKLDRDPTEKEIAKKVKALEKKAAASEEGGDDADAGAAEAVEEAKEEPAAEAAAPATPAGGGAANPDNISDCFVGNLSYDIDDDGAKAFFKDCGEISEIRWNTDKETGKFYGSGFISFADAGGAAAAVALAGSDCMGRPIKVEFAKPRTQSARKPRESKPLSEKPEDCVTVFCGNCSYEITDEDAQAFFKECGDVKKVRWLTDRETGEFKGCGFIEFYTTEAVDNAIKLNGQDCKGRAMRIDYAASKKKEF